MRAFVLWVWLFSLVASGANAASYQMTDGTVVDPILTTGGAVHSYSGPNLHAGANAVSADLAYADLAYADLDGAVLTYADLTDAHLDGANLFFVDLSGANLTGANLYGADLFFADLPDANLTGANLTGAVWLGYTSGSAYYNAETDFTDAWSGSSGSTPFDPVAAGWTFIPEPNTALLLTMGFVGLAGRRRRAH